MSGIMAGALISGGIQILGGILGGGAAKKRERAARREKAKLNRKLNYLENNRQPITDPYAGVTSLAGLATDLSSQLTNNMANLSVATQAAEMEIEQADISLANTLDTIRATGAGAGGATALAQAALSSKKGVSASIEQQEAQNEVRRAQGEANLERLQMAEAQRIQNIGMSEAQRIQQAGVAGKQFVFSARERREGEQLDRVSAQISGAQKQAAQASADRAAISSSMISGLGNIAGSLITSGTLGSSGQQTRGLVNTVNDITTTGGYTNMGSAEFGIRTPIPTSTNMNTSNYTPMSVGPQAGVFTG